MQFNFLGPSNALVPVNADAERSVNLLPTLTGPGTPKAPFTLEHTPGKRVGARLNGVTDGTLTIHASSVDVLWYETSTPNARTFGLAGDSFFELVGVGNDPPWTVVPRGAVQDAPTNFGQRRSITSNGLIGNQLFIVSYGKGYIFDLVTNVFALITDPDFPLNPWMGTFLDDYFIVLNGTNSSIQLSALSNGLAWSATDVAERSDTADPVKAIVAVHSELWWMGTRTMEPWFDSGNSAFPFEPVQGGLIQFGVGDFYTIQIVGDKLFCVGHDPLSNAALVYRFDGYTPVQVSPPALRYVSGVSFSQPFRAWTWGDSSGHLFYCLRYGGDATTWCYDLYSQLWFEMGVFDEERCEFGADDIQCHITANGKDLGGSAGTATVYWLSQDFYNDEVP